ncbi:MAG TPA: GTP 3',8-cyclase MoaA [Thermoanaerobaculia bacterium]|nr:GTP 3',8-cyclase MoaA [Thermoanaerobaculia bacterium]
MNSPTPLDRLGRPLRDLRISVTDRCNFRCIYCMPKEVFGRDHQFLERDELLSFEEIARLAKIAVGRGVEKIRITGGEPLVRRELPKLISMLSPIPGLLDLTLTTNGSLLAAQARSLKDAGLQRITVSLDALDDATFQTMNDVEFPVARVLEGIDAAIEVGLAPIKINMVVKRGLNEHAILEMARRFRGQATIVRFIEYMDVGSTNHWRLHEVVPASEIVSTIHAQLELAPIGPLYPGEVAQRYRYTDGGGEIGVISSVTQPFCQDCTRARISSDGSLYTCLFASTGHDLRALLRSPASDIEIGNALDAIWRLRDDRYSEVRATAAESEVRVEMSHIGG